MQPPKRQIIKTRPQQPYIVARIILLIIVVAALSLGAWFFLRPHHAGEEAPFAERMAQVQTSVERSRS